MNEYMVKKRFRGKAICGDVNLPYGTPADLKNGNMITVNGKDICRITSQNAYDFFVRNDDGNGYERANLIQKIMCKLVSKDDNYQKRWDKLWDDKIANSMRRKEHEDFWCWSFDFYNASVADLQHIWGLIGGL